MFILRRITSRGQESNEVLGKSYDKIFSWQTEEENAKEFKALLEPMAHPDDIYGFVIFEKGSNYRPLYKKSDYFIMCSDGKTFERINFK
ncbi:hypothetical protein [Christiangramia sp.]|uniref:hypothetical protein n=1 Tax=Christiangramia sp. TaxID=1931228 RepID=UPI00261F1A24|nr:hypothetical protein [Christiangramia sp.]